MFGDGGRAPSSSSALLRRSSLDPSPPLPSRRRRQRRPLLCSPPAAGGASSGLANAGTGRRSSTCVPPPPRSARPACRPSRASLAAHLSPVPCDACSRPLCALPLRAAGHPPARAAGRVAPRSPSEMHLRREGVYICTFSLQRRQFASRVDSPVGEGAVRAQCRLEMHFAFALTDASPVGVSLSVNNMH